MTSTNLSICLFYLNFFLPTKPLYVPQDGFNLEIGTSILSCKKRSEVHPVQKLNRWRHQVELKNKIMGPIFSVGDSSDSLHKRIMFEGETTYRHTVGLSQWIPLHLDFNVFTNSHIFPTEDRILPQCGLVIF